MSMLFDPFYKLFGIRTVNQLMTPPLPDMAFLDLPKRSILHFVTSSPVIQGPASDELIFRRIKRPILMDHVVEVGDLLGMPRKLPINPQPAIRTYHLQNRRFRMMKDLAAADRDANALIVYNYGMLPGLYKYIRNAYTEYYKWWNVEAAVWKKVAEVAEQTDRQQFILCKLPTVLPSLSDLRVGTAGVTQKMVKIFNNPESLFLLQLWMWFGEERAQSVLGKLPETAFARVNLIFQESGKWFVMNLGKLNSWRVATEEELKANPKANIKGLQADQMQRRYLRLMMSLFEVRTVPQPAPEVKTSEVAEKKSDASLTQGVIKQAVSVPKMGSDGVVKVGAKETETPEEVKFVPPHADQPDTTSDTIKVNPEDDQQIEAELAELEMISKKHVGPHEEEGEVEHEILEPKTLEDGVMKVCDRFAEAGMLSAAEYRRYSTLASSYRRIVSPNKNQTLDEFIKIEPVALAMPESPAIKDIPTVVDKTMLKSSLHTFDQRYTKDVLQKDVAAAVLNIQNAGIAVTDYEVERIEDVTGASDAYTIRVTPVDGSSSTLRFRLPAVEDDGTYTTNGIKYRLRKQRGDLPIRKIAPDTVALTSYYGKTFVTRSAKKVNDYGNWLCNQIMALGLNGTDGIITNLQPSPVFDNGFVCPRLYSILAKGFKAFTLTPKAFNVEGKGSLSYQVQFDHTKREELFGSEALKRYEKNGAIILGSSLKNSYMVMDAKDQLFISDKDGNLVACGNIEALLNLDSFKAPVDFAELKVMGQVIPVGVVLAYELGLSRLMKMLGVVPRRVTAGTRVNLEANEYSLVFSDETLVFSKENRLASLILAGFNEYHRAIKQYSMHEYDKRAVYLNTLEAAGAGVRYLREIDLMYQMFVDPITKDLLIEMKEPTEFRPLLLRSCEMLMTDHHPDELDPAFMRIKGYERFAGAAYSEIVKSIRAHNGRPGKSKQPIDLNPYAVWKAIAQDPSVAIVSDINPINNVKEIEAVTFAGTGGRSSRSMVQHTREFHTNDLGTISEASTDSGDVGINFYTSADPQFTSLRGMSRRIDLKNPSPTSLFSSSTLNAVASDQDDMRRINFVSIQNSHSVACDGYQQAPVRTGYEQVIAHRTSDLYAMTSKKPGKVVSVTEEGMVVEYDDGETKGFELGRRFGAAAGLMIPHDVVSDMKPGQKFKEGELLCYNSGFFEKDHLNPGGVAYKSCLMARTVLLESSDTLDDSSAISASLAERLKTKTTKVKRVVVNFDQSVRRIVKAGQAIESEDILCIIEDAVTANNNLFDEESLDTLRLLSAQTPQAKVKGKVDRIEVFYHGDKEDMSESLRKLANETDREMARRYKAAGKKPFTGSVDDNYRVEGDPLVLDTMVIVFYLTGEVSMTVGDKLVFVNQMKSVTGRIMSDETQTESGKPIEAIFGMQSVFNRVVNSPTLIGTTATLLDVLGKKAVALYRS